MLNKRFGFVLLLALVLILCTGLFSFAIAEGGQVSGRVFVDKNADGVMNEGERALQNATVTLCKAYPNGETEDITSVKTGKDGLYAFSTAQNDTYAVRFTLPNEYRFTIFGAESAVKPVKGSTGYTLPFTLENDQQITMNAGAVTGNSYVSIVAFEDENLNGGRRDSEPLLRYVKVELYWEHEGKSHLIAEAVTDKKGETSISELAPGSYYIKAVLPENYVSGPMGTKMSIFYNFMEPSLTNICYSPVFEVPNKGGAAIGIGAVKTGSLSGSVWQDKNANGTPDSDEAGCPGMKLSLYSETLDITRTTDILTDGTFTFTGLQPSEYELTYTLPDGMIFADSASSAICEIAASASLPVTVEVEKTAQVSPVGAAAASWVEVYVTDAGHDNAPLAGVAGSIEQKGKTVSTAVSDENGLMRFNVVRGGDAILSYTLPEGYVVAKEGGAFPYENGCTTGSVPVQVPADEGLVLNASAIESIRISGCIVEDPTNTGAVSNEYLRLAGFTVAAIDDEGNLAVGEAVTDENGAYVLENLHPGTYTIRFSLDDCYIATPFAAIENESYNAIFEQDPEYGYTQPITLSAGESKQFVNAAFFKAGIADGFVVLNTACGELSGSEPGMEGITVTLLKEDGTPYQDYAYSVTDGNGFFCIKGILPGHYMLQYALPENAVFVNPAQPMDTLIYTGHVFAVENGSQIHADTVGAVWTSAFSGCVTDYTSGAGVSATITMTDPESGHTHTCATDENGAYAFPKLMPRLHQMQIELHDGYVFADSQDSILPYHNASSVTASVSLFAGSVDEDCNIIVSQPVDWTVQLYYDENGNQTKDETEPFAANRTVELYLRDDLIATVSCDENGQVLFDQIIPASYTLRIPLKEREVLVATPDTDLCTVSSDFTQIALLQYAALEGHVWSLDGSENGIAGLPVSLLKDGNVIDSCVSAADGLIHFENLLKGTYTLEAQLPEGYLFARAQDAASRASFILSQNNGTPQSMPFEISMGQQKTDGDIGIGGVGAIGDTAWIDENKNGMQDIGEPLLPGVQIELYQYGELIAKTQTDVYGRYSLKNLYPGVYEMHVTTPKEVKPTVRQTLFPLVASVLPESDETTVVVENVVVPSMGRDLNVDLGYQLRKKNVYPASLKTTPQKDWTPYHHREE